MSGTIKQSAFGHVNGTEILQTTMENENGVRVSTMTYGAAITEIAVPDRHGIIENVVCSFPNVEGYIANPQFFGATIGPFAGRLENATLRIYEEEIQLTPNEGKHLLHGGDQGFHQQIWNVTTEQCGQELRTMYDLTYNTDYPGPIFCHATFSLLPSNTLEIVYEARAENDTYINLTNHSYFNLSGNLKRTVVQHELTIPAAHYLPINEEGLPLNECEAAAGTLFDFRQKKSLGSIIGADHPQIALAKGGLDHPFLLNGEVIELSEPESGRTLRIVTEDKAAVIYTGNKIGEGFHFLDAPATNFSGICIEEQNVPNSVLHPNLPSSFVKGKTTYHKKTLYHFL